MSMFPRCSAFVVAALLRSGDGLGRPQMAFDRQSFGEALEAENQDNLVHCPPLSSIRNEQALFDGNFLESSNMEQDEVDGCNQLEARDDVTTLSMQTGRLAEGSASMVVWVTGFPRSGSSTALSMVSATVDNNRPGEKVFSLFEPCHPGDVMNKTLKQSGCRGVVKNLAQCDFRGIYTLWGWNDPHSSNGFSSYSPQFAHRMCEKADVIAFKTVDFGHDLSEMQGMLDATPSMKVIDVVRDPRGIYASYKTVEPFKTLVRQPGYYTISSICKDMAANLRWNHPRVHRLVFEWLVNKPLKQLTAAYHFLGLPVDGKAQQWVNDVFGVTDCPEPGINMEHFSDCHEKASGDLPEKWHDVLTQQERDEFANNPDCIAVAEAYGYHRQ